MPLCAQHAVWHTSSSLIWQDGRVAAMLPASLGLNTFQLALGAARCAIAGVQPSCKLLPKQIQRIAIVMLWAAIVGVFV